MASGLLDSGFSCVLQMPTGSGKTWLAEHSIEQALQNGLRAIYLTPLRALADELSQNWRTRFSGYKVGVFTGDYGTGHQTYPIPFRDAQLLVMTPERLDACTRSWRSHWSWIPEVDLVVIDELHLLGDRNRGARLEGAISRFRRLNPFARFLGLSATLGNREELADWLDAVEYSSSWRPIPLHWRIAHYRRADEKPALLLAEVTRNLSSGGKTMVFVQSRRRAEELSLTLQSAGVRAVHHHAGLSHDLRRETENNFRSCQVDVLVCTATLEMGLNLPTRQVILYDLQFFDGSDFRALTTNSVWQRVGRAGRPGHDLVGEAVLLAPIWDHHADCYTQPSFEPIRSGLSEPRAIAEQIVAEVTSGLARSASQLHAIFNQSLAARQRSLPQVDKVITDMQSSGMIRYKQHEGTETWTLQATQLGRIATRHMLSPSTMLLFRWVLDIHPELTFFDLLLLASASPDCEPILPVDFEELESLTSNIEQQSSHLLQLTRSALTSLLEIDGKRLLASLKMALVARSWTSTSSYSAAADRHNCYPFEVQRLQESLNRLLLAMHALSAVPDCDELPVSTDDHLPMLERVAALRQMVAAGLDEYAVTLTFIPGIGPTMAKRLGQSGVLHIEDLAQRCPEDLRDVPGLSIKRAQSWIAQAITVLCDRSALRYVEGVERPALTQSPWPLTLAPYRLRRALDLQVARSSGTTYLVTGGLEPHIVRLNSGDLSCDCKDAHEHLCKHVLAVRLHRGDKTLRQLASRLDIGSGDDRLNLFDLWFSSRPQQNRRRAR